MPRGSWSFMWRYHMSFESTSTNQRFFQFLDWGRGREITCVSVSQLTKTTENASQTYLKPCLLRLYSQPAFCGSPMCATLLWSCGGDTV